MDALTYISMVVFGLMAGILGGFLGTGGCVIMLPTLRFIYGYELPLAIATTVTAVVITATSGAIGHIRIKNVDFGTVKVVAISGALGAVIGSILFSYLVGQRVILEFIVGGSFLYVAIRMIYEGIRRRRVEKPGNKIPGSVWVKCIVGLVIGILTGILGLGGGYALVPTFIYLLHAPTKIAVGTSLASFISMASVSAGFKIYQGLVDALAAITLGIGTAIGAQIGARLVLKAPIWLIKLLFGVVFLYISLKFILDSFGIKI